MYTSISSSPRPPTRASNSWSLFGAPLSGPFFFVFLCLCGWVGVRSLLRSFFWRRGNGLRKFCRVLEGTEKGGHQPAYGRAWWTTRRFQSPTSSPHPQRNQGGPQQGYLMTPSLVSGSPRGLNFPPLSIQLTLRTADEWC